MGITMSLNGFDPFEPESESTIEEEHPLVRLYPRKVLSISDVLKMQEEAVEHVMKYNLNGMFPDESPIWTEPDWVKGVEPEDHWPKNWPAIALNRHAAEMDRIYALATKRFDLHDLKIDRAMVLLGLVSTVPKEPELLKWYTDDGKFAVDGHFLLMGLELGHMDGHVCVARVADGKLFPVAHAFDFYLLPPNET